MPYQCDPCLCPEQHYRDSMSWRKAMITLLCNIRESFSTFNPFLNATFDPAIDLDASDIGTGYALAVDLPDSTRSVTFVNQMNGTVVVSMDAGVHDHFVVAPNQTIFINLAAIGRVTTAAIHVKDGADVADDGHFYIYSAR